MIKMLLGFTHSNIFELEAFQNAVLKHCAVSVWKFLGFCILWIFLSADQFRRGVAVSRHI